jgi:hypothetical protein
MMMVRYFLFVQYYVECRANTNFEYFLWWQKSKKRFESIRTFRSPEMQPWGLNHHRALVYH